MAPQVVHSRQRMQPVTFTFSSTFTPMEQRLRQRLHSTQLLELKRRWKRLSRLNRAKNPPRGQSTRHHGRWMKIADRKKVTRIRDLYQLMAQPLPSIKPCAEKGSPASSAPAGQRRQMETTCSSKGIPLRPSTAGNSNTNPTSTT